MAQAGDIASDLGLHIGADDGNRTRTISLGSLWRCSPATCRFVDLRACRRTVRE
jgi:hypothetical protein